MIVQWIWEKKRVKIKYKEGGNKVSGNGPVRRHGKKVVNIVVQF